MAFRPQRDKVQSHDGATEDYQPVFESFSSFLEATSLHGARFLTFGSVIRRFIWILALASCFGFCTYQVYETMKAFYKRPFNTKITTKTANDATVIPFPAVSLCNFNFLNKRRYIDSAKRNNLSNEEIEQKMKIIGKMITGSKDVYNNESQQHYPELFFRAYGEVSEDKNYFALHSHRIEDMLLPSSLFQSCVIDGKACVPENFFPFTTSKYGQCYTFNSGRDSLPLINATIDGHVSGLKLLLNIERDSYLYLYLPGTPFVGLTVLVHDQRNYPLMAQYSFAVEPGIRTLCSIKMKKVCRLVPP